MSSYLSAKNSLSPSIHAGRKPSCNIKGRIIPYMEFLPRLKNYCLSLGFKKPIVILPELMEASDTNSVVNPDPFLVGKNRALPGNDSIIILSAKVPYETSWGGYSGLPRPLIHERADHRAEATVSNFIAPYLLEYQFAQKHIYLSCNEEGQYLVTLPSEFIKSEARSDGRKLKIHLDKIAESDENGLNTPLRVSKPLVSYQLSPHFVQLLRDSNFPWQKGRIQRIGKFLTKDFFEFVEPKQLDGRNSAFAETLLPAMNCIVTNANPQLRAALIHLQSEFSRTVDDVLSTHGQKDTENLLCIAGLDIDVAAFKGRGQRYFVPWASYWQHGGTQQEDKDQLEQDDLFVALMAQEKQCLV